MKLTKTFLLLFIGTLVYGPPTIMAQSVSTLLSAKQQLHFLENKGQITDQYGIPRKDIDFKLAATNGLNIFIGSGSIYYQWSAVKKKTCVWNLSQSEGDAKSKANMQLGNVLNRKDFNKEDTVFEMYRMDVELIGANKNAKVVCEDPLSYYEQYYTGACGLEGATAKAFQRVIYKDVYPNIDWEFYFNAQGKLEHDFVVHPGGRVADIQIKYAGSSGLRLDENGVITATTPMGAINENAPYSFQEDGQAIVSKFVVTNNVISFQVDAYEGKLTIDPTLEWATYYGGFADEGISFAKCDNNKNVYLLGATYSTSNIATIGSYQNSLAGVVDVFLVKFNDSGIRLWSTYYGGEDWDEVGGITIDTGNNVYIVGETSSRTNIATSGSHQSAIGGSLYDYDGFIAKFDSIGQLQWSTYYGGEDMDGVRSITHDKYGYVYIAGYTWSENGISSIGTHQSSIGGNNDLYLAKFSSNGIRQWGTYYGGDEGDDYPTVACDGNGNIYLSGTTGSLNGIATVGSHQFNIGGGLDMFLSKFNDEGVRQWATYYGGSGNEELNGSVISIDDSGNVYMLGNSTSKMGIVTPGCYQSTFNGTNAPFIVKFDSSGIRKWGTYYEDEGTEAFGILSLYGDVIITGYTGSLTGLATLGAYQTNNNGSYNAFISRFSGTGLRIWATYYGGDVGDFGTSLTHDGIGNLYLGGFTWSTKNVATPGSYQTMLSGGSDLFLAKFCFAALAPLNISGADSICAYSDAVYKIPSSPGIDVTYMWELSSGWIGTSNGDSILITTNDKGGVISVKSIHCGDTSISIFKDVSIFPSSKPEITVSGFKLGTSITYKSYQWMLNGSIVPGATNSSYTVNENGDYQVVVSNEAGCIDTSSIYKIRNVTFIDDVDILSSQISIYPNPAKNIIHINSPVETKLTLYGAEGKKIEFLQNEKSMPMDGLSKGVYFLQIRDKNDNLIKVEKIVKVE